MPDIHLIVAVFFQGDFVIPKSRSCLLPGEAFRKRITVSSIRGCKTANDIFSFLQNDSASANK